MPFLSTCSGEPTFSLPCECGGMPGPTYHAKWSMLTDTALALHQQGLPQNLYTVCAFLWPRQTCVPTCGCYKFPRTCVSSEKTSECHRATTSHCLLHQSLGNVCELTHVQTNLQCRPYAAKCTYDAHKTVGPYFGLQALHNSSGAVVTAGMRHHITDLAIAHGLAASPSRDTQRTEIRSCGCSPTGQFP